MAAAKNYAKKNGYSVDGNKELLGFGAPHIVAGLLQGFPVDASYSNTAVNEQSGGKTQLSSAVAGILIAIVLLFFATFFSNLPQTIIGAVIIVAALSLIDLKEIRSIYHFDRMEFIFAAIALFGVLLFGLLEGILIGLVVTFLALLYRVANPYIAILGRIPGTDDFSDIRRRPENETIPGILVIRVNAPLFFPNVEGLKDKIDQMARNREEPVRLVILALGASYYLDMSAVKTLRSLHEELAEKGVEFKVAEATGPVRDKLRKGGLEELFGELGPTVDIDNIIRNWQKNEEKKT
jgi:MFS superfamily sulfate permease-like transporter